MGLDEAMQEIFSDGYDPNDTSSEDEAVRKVLAFGETVGTLVKHGLLDWDLLSDLYWIDGMWKKVEAHAVALRERLGEPRIYEHFESLAARSGS
jgi:hypothetical protein